MPTRSRSQGAIVTASRTKTVKVCNSSCGETQSSTVYSDSGPRSGVTKTTVDVHPSSWKTTREKGLYVIEPFDSKTVTVTSGGSGMARQDSGVVCSSCNYLNFTKSEDWTSYFAQVGYTSLIEPATPYSEGTLVTSAWNSALANLKDPDVEGLVMLAEMQQTIQMLRNPLGQARYWFERRKNQSNKSKDHQARADEARTDGYKDKHARIASDSRANANRAAAKAAASAHLEFIFGILPLMRDIEHILGAIEKKFRRAHRARGSSSNSAETVTTSTATYRGVDIMTVQTTTTWNTTVKAGAAASLEAYSSFNGSMGLRLSDIPSAAYELIPFSFVLGWFINLDDYIRGLTTMIDGRLLGGYSTIIRDVTVKREIISHTPAVASWQITRSCRDWETVNFKTIHRSPEGGGPYKPSFQPSLNLGRISALLSLIIQRA